MVFCHNNRKQIGKVSQFHITVVNYFKGSVERGEDADITQFLLTKGLPNLPDLNSQQSKTSQATIVLIFIKCIL